MRIDGQRILGWHKTVKYRIDMRNNPTPAEAVLWECLKGKKLHDLRFRRQHGVGPYIADFYHAPTKTIIELDGEIHSNPAVKANDKEREEYLKRCGYNIIRFQNYHVLNDLNGVLKKILHTISPLQGNKGLTPNYCKDYPLPIRLTLRYHSHPIDQEKYEFIWKKVDSTK